MANTNGGFIVLGLEEDADGNIGISGIKQHREVIKSIWNVLNNSEKVSINILSDDNVYPLDYQGGDTYCY